MSRGDVAMRCWIWTLALPVLLAPSVHAADIPTRCAIVAAHCAPVDPLTPSAYRERMERLHVEAAREQAKALQAGRLLDPRLNEKAKALQRRMDASAADLERREGCTMLRAFCARHGVR